MFFCGLPSETRGTVGFVLKGKEGNEVLLTSLQNDVIGVSFVQVEFQLTRNLMLINVFLPRSEDVTEDVAVNNGDDCCLFCDSRMFLNMDAKENNSVNKRRIK